MTRPGFAVLLIVAVAVAAGCGGDDGLSKSEFLTKAEAICADANRQEATFIPPADAHWDTSPAAVADFNAISEDALRELRELPAPPAEIREPVDAVFAAIERSIAAGDDRAKRDSAYLELAASAGPAGFTECAGVTS